MDGERVLLKLHDDGLIQLVNRATARTLAPGLVRRVNRGLPSAEVVAWLIEQPGVAEVFAEDSELAAALAAASPPDAAPAPAPLPVRPAEPTYDLEFYDDAWHMECDIDLGFGEVTIAMEVEAEQDAPRIAAALEVLRGGWSRLLAPALAEYAEPLFSDAAKAAASFEHLTLYIRPVGWSIQLTFNARGMRTTGYFLDFDGDRIVGGSAGD